MAQRGIPVPPLSFDDSRGDGLRARARARAIRRRRRRGDRDARRGRGGVFLPARAISASQLSPDSPGDRRYPPSGRYNLCRGSRVEYARASTRSLVPHPQADPVYGPEGRWSSCGIVNDSLVRDWLSFWNSPNRIYVNDRHRDVHYRDVALQIRALVPSATATVVDYGCGEATAADLVAEAAGRLILSTARRRCARSFPRASKPMRRLPCSRPKKSRPCPRHIDCIVMNSVAQYLDPADLDDLFAMFRRLLAADGRFVIGDVIPPHTSAVNGVAALISLAWRNGFLAPALAGLVRTLFSDYRALRTGSASPTT